MQALVYTGTEKLEYKNFQEPNLVGGESIIKVVASGICGSDMHAYHGKDERRVPPLILGHEVSGIIEKGSKKDKTPNIKNGQISGNACEHWDRYKEDIKLIKNIGVSYYRFSIYQGSSERHAEPTGVGRPSD